MERRGEERVAKKNEKEKGERRRTLAVSSPPTQSPFFSSSSPFSTRGWLVGLGLELFFSLPSALPVLF